MGDGCGRTNTWPDPVHPSATTTPVGICQEEQGSRRRRRSSQPLPRGDSTYRIRPIEHRAGTSDTPASRPVAWHHEHSRNRPCFPRQTFVNDPRREPDLLVLLSKRLLDRDELGLHLHDEDQAEIRAPSDDVDGTALTVDRVCHLRRRFPAEHGEPPHRLTDELGVALVEQPVERSSAPADFDLRRGVECREDGSDHPERRRGDVTALEERYLLLAHAGATRDVRLSPPSTQPESAHRSADAHVVHAAIVARGARRVLT